SSVVSFGRKVNGTHEVFLGQVIEPEDISLEQVSLTDRNSFSHRIANSVVVDNFLAQAARLAGDETYSRAIADVFFDGFGIDSLRRFFTYGDESLNAIRGRNPAMRTDDFYRARSGRPFLVVNSTLLRTENAGRQPNLIHFETTPLYAGVRVRHPRAGINGTPIGGGYIEPFAIDSNEPDRAPDQDSVVRVHLGRRRHRYTLSDVMGKTGAAPAEILDRIGFDFLGFPEFKHWPILHPHRASAKEYEFGDGGHLENLGIMPLILRGVEKLVVFVNTKDKLESGNLGEINDSIPPLFGQKPGFTLNHVFPRSQYQKLVDGLLEAKSSGTVMFRDIYRVGRVPHYGIAGGWDIEVLWVYNHRVDEWEDRLRQEVRDLIGSGSLGSFPHYKTFFQNPPAVIDLSGKQVNMLAHLSCWNITRNEDVFREMLS
ncbi:MAG: hypothetical protein AAF420_14510, partial [Pseudomonadota bacterium]